MKCKIFILSVIFLFSLSIIYALDYTIPPNTYSIQSGDFDNDGDNDIVVGHINQDIYQSLIKNIGNGEFEIAEKLTSDETRSFYLFFTIDENCLADFLIQNEYSDLIIFYDSDFNNPYFYDIQQQLGLKSVTYGDFDGDDDFDLVFSSYGVGYDNLWGVIYNLGNREFSMPVWYVCPNQAGNAGFDQLECHDIDDNGYDDIIAFSFANTYIYYFSEDGFMVDSLDYQITSSGMTSADFDNDNDYDIIITHWPTMTQDNLKIYENVGNQNFTLHNYYCETLWAEPISCELNNDDLFDIVTVGDEIKKYYNEGNLQFSEISIQDYPDYGESWVESSFSDFDGNGTQDVAIIRYGIDVNNLTILYNEGDGNFIEEPVSVDNHQIHIPRYYVSNYPNPFKKETVILYTLPVHVSNPVIEIFNIKGEKIKSLNLGVNNVIWDGTDNYHKTVSSGIYFYQVISDDYMSKTKQMLLLK